MTKHKGLIVASAVVLLVPGLSAPAAHGAEQAPPAAESIASYNGEELFQAVLFGQGPALKSVEDIVPKPADAEADRVSDEYMEIATAAIRAEDPEFFGTFRTEVTSGDQVRVLQALSDAGEKSVTALKAEGIDLTKAADAGGAEGECIFVIVVVVVAAAAAVTAAGGANVVAGANFLAAANVSVQVNVTTSAAEKTLDQDRFVGDVTDRLAV